MHSYLPSKSEVFNLARYSNNITGISKINKLNQINSFKHVIPFPPKDRLIEKKKATFKRHNNGYTDFGRVVLSSAKCEKVKSTLKKINKKYL